MSVYLSSYLDIYLKVQSSYAHAALAPEARWDGNHALNSGLVISYVTTTQSHYTDSLTAARIVESRCLEQCRSWRQGDTTESWTPFCEEIFPAKIMIGFARLSLVWLYHQKRSAFTDALCWVTAVSTSQSSLLRASELLPTSRRCIQFAW